MRLGGTEDAENDFSKESHTSDSRLPIFPHLLKL